MTRGKQQIAKGKHAEQNKEKTAGDSNEIKKYPYPKVFFGADGGEDIDWRKFDDGGFADRDDDELEEETPEEVINILGFDPKDL